MEVFEPERIASSKSRDTKVSDHFVPFGRYHQD
jgi:hypothetical protein